MKPEEIGTNLEKYDFEFFMNEAMNYVPNDIDIREGSIMYDALAPACYQLATLAMELKNMMLETFVVSATGGYLDLRAEEAGVARIKATYAVVTATITSSDGSPLNLESGSRFSSIGEHPVYYKVTEKLTDGKYHLTAEIPGMAGNEYIGTILPLDNLNDFGQAIITEVTIPARDIETDDSLRKRVISEKKVTAFGGNTEDYIRMVNGIDGVGDVQVYPIWKGGGTVLLVILNNSYRKPSEKLVSDVQEVVDPIQGTGIGLAPIGHKVTVKGPTERILPIQFELTVNNDLNKVSIAEEIKVALEKYFYTLRKEWGTKKSNGYECWVYRSQITSVALSVEGVANISNIAIDGQQTDISMVLSNDLQELPVMGEVNVL
ncbi:baseplate J/gp47 family protein [Aerococcaceae bacterium 50-4]